MNDIDHTLFVYKNKITDEVWCKFFDEAQLIDLTQYDHIATINPRMYIQYWWEGIERLREEKA